MEKIVKNINYIYNTFHSQNNNYTTKERLKGIADGYKNIIDIAKNNYKEEAHKYYKKRTSEDKKITKIQKEEIKNIKKCLKKLDFEIMPASSFSAKVNVIGESDIDFLVKIKDMYNNIKNNKLDDLIEISNRLGKCGYKFSEVNAREDPIGTYYVFSKINNGIEIEVKVRDYDGCRFISELHNYVDNKLDLESKIYTTYIKQFFKLPENKSKYKEEYWKFKAIYSENALYETKSPKLMLPLVDI